MEDEKKEKYSATGMTRKKQHAESQEQNVKNTKGKKRQRTG